jgi:hypothetical protein
MEKSKAVRAAKGSEITPTNFKKYGLQLTTTELLDRARNEYRKNSRWVEIYKAGRFDQKKAALSMMEISELQEISPANWKDKESTTSPTLAGLSFYRGEAYAVKFLLNQIANLVDFFDADIRLPGIKIAAEVILSEYHFLTVADINLCFRMGAAKQLTQYGKWTPSSLLDWVEDYNNQRITRATNKSKPKPVTKLLEGARAEMPEKTRALLESMEKTYLQAEIAERARNPQKVQTISFREFYENQGLDPDRARNMLAEKWEKEFLDQGLESHGAKLSDYLAFKFIQFTQQINTPNKPEKDLLDLDSGIYH